MIRDLQDNPNLIRRLIASSLWLPLLPTLQGCGARLTQLKNTTSPEAQALLMESATAHGLAAFSKINDLSISYTGKWHTLVGKLQPVLVDSGFRGGSEERWLRSEHRVAQAHTGPKGTKQVVRNSSADSGDVMVWFNGEEAHDNERRAAAALVVDGYSLFLLGPMLLALGADGPRANGQPQPVLQLAGTSNVVVGRHPYSCDVLRVHIEPGLGFSATDELELYIDVKERLMRRVRFSLNGLESTRGAIAEVDTFEHTTLQGVRWPTHFQERLVRPLPLSVHDWQLTGLDVNRGFSVADISGATFVDKAIAPAKGFSQTDHY